MKGRYQNTLTFWHGLYILHGVRSCSFHMKQHSLRNAANSSNAVRESRIL